MAGKTTTISIIWTRDVVYRKGRSKSLWNDCGTGLEGCWKREWRLNQKI